MFTSAASSALTVGLDRPSPQRTSVGEQTSSFAQQLATVIEQYLGETDPDAGLQIEIRPETSLKPGSRQFSVTVTGSSSPLDAAAPADSESVPPPAVYRPLLPETLPWVPPPSTKSSMPYANSREAYWAAQPPEVQELRTMTERDDRDAKGRELAARGFTIDYPIMVWQWDPLSTMRARVNAGYSWVPAVGQPSVEVAPGLSFPGLKSYDPRNPPPGSIPVSMAFAEGYDS